METPKKKSSITLTPHAAHLIKLLAIKAGLSVSAWIETQIRQEAKRERVG